MRAGLPVSEMTTMMASLGVNLAVAIVLFFLLGGRKLTGQKALAGATSPPVPHVTVARAQEGPQIYGDAEAVAQTQRKEEIEKGADSLLEDHHAEEAPTPNRAYQMLTVLGLILLAVLTLYFNLDIGFVSISIGLVLSLISPNLQKRALGQVSWPEIMLICGVSTYVGVLQKMGTIDFVGHSVAAIGSPLVAALLLCFIGGVVSAFASSTAVLGSLIPLAVPLLQSGGGVDAVGFVAAMAVSSTIVDVSPFSTSGALVLANSRASDRDRMFRQLLGYGFLVTVVGPIVVWFLFVVL